jgi:hypothetical protein
VAPAQRRSLVRTTSWCGLSPGDAVVIDLPRERRGEFRFVAHVRNEATGDEWVEVRGGRRGDVKDRSFAVETVYPAAARKGSQIAGPSLVDAPQLDLSAPVPTSRKRSTKA